MRILYMTQWFEPEPNIIKGLAFVRELHAAGHDVTVVTGVPNYPIGRFYPGYRLRLVQHEVLEGIRITRLPLYPSHDASTLRRSLNFLSFFVALFIYCLLRGRRFDVVYAYHPPITVGLAAALAGWVHRLPMVLDAQDLWPDTVSTVGFRGTKALAPAIEFLCWFVYRRAALIIVPSAGIRRTFAARGVPPRKISLIHNWAVREACSASRRSDEGLERTTIVYAGNFGRAQGLATVIDAAEILARRRQDIDIRLIGDGIEEDALRERAQGVRGISIERRVPPAEIDVIIGGADAVLLHLRDEPLFRITVPSKTQAYLAYGRPIVAAIVGEAADLLRESDAAIVVPPSDPAALADAISEMADLPRERRDAMGEAGRRYYLANMSFAAGMKSTLSVIDSARAA